MGIDVCPTDAGDAQTIYTRTIYSICYVPQHSQGVFCLRYRKIFYRYYSLYLQMVM
jgi:hypothetical protein